MSFDFAATQRRAVDSVTRPTVDPTQSRNGAIPVSRGAAQPFFQDATITLSRPAHIRDYQGDAAALPFRTQRPEELAPYIPTPASAVPPSMPKLEFTSEAEQQWLQERDAAVRAELARQTAAQPARDYSQPPPPFESKLGFRPPAPFEPMPKPIKEFCHQDGVSKEFFWGGTGRFVSENGTANSQKYFSLARPLGGRLKSHYTTQTTPFGYRFDQYTSRP